MLVETDFVESGSQVQLYLLQPRTEHARPFDTKLLNLHTEFLSPKQQDDLSNVKNAISHLYNNLNVEQHLLAKEQFLVKKLKSFQREIGPYEIVCIVIVTIELIMQTNKEEVSLLTLHNFYASACY